MIARLLVDHPGVGQPRTGAVFEALVGAVLDQRVTSFEAQRGYEQVVQATSEPAPGPAGLWLPPDGDALAGMAFYDLHVMGVEQVRAETLVRLAAQCTRASTRSPACPRSRDEPASPSCPASTQASRRAWPRSRSATPTRCASAIPCSPRRSPGC